MEKGGKKQSIYFSGILNFFCICNKFFFNFQILSQKLIYLFYKCAQSYTIIFREIHLLTGNQLFLEIFSSFFNSSIS